MLCAVLAFPIIVAGVVIGAGIGVLVRKLFVDRSENQTATIGILLLVGPTLILAGERFERPILQHPRTGVIQTTVEVNDPPERVWGRILSIDNVQASKPILMYIGLPIPQRCTTQGHGIGAKRTCYFNVILEVNSDQVTFWRHSHAFISSATLIHRASR